MNLSSLPPGDPDRPLICYQGSFDPPHKGHVSALETAMEKTRAVAAVIIVCNGENPEKPHRSSWEMRKEMARACFGHLSNVWVSEVPDKETKSMLLKNKYVLTLIGSDAWPKYSKRPNIPFYGICISLRHPETVTNYPSEIGQKKIICIDPAVQGISSTKVRAFFNLHPEVYEHNALLPDCCSTYLESDTLNYIINTRLYYQSREDKIQQVAEEIQKYIKKYVFKDLSFHLRCLTGDNLSSSNPRGKSGDLTFLVSSKDQGKIFIKAFVTPNHEKAAEKEIGGIQSLSHLSIQGLKGPDLIYWQQTHPTYSHIGVPFFEEPDVATFFQMAPSQETLEQICRICFCVGRSLAELHHVQTVPIESQTLQEITELLNRRTKSRIQKLSSEKQEDLSSAFTSSYLSFLQNPGPHTFVHGDASLSNFLFDVEKEEVRLVDLGSFFAFQTKEGTPRGFPAEDYYRFLGDLSWLNGKNPMPPDAISSLKQAFEQGYLTRPSIITNEAHKYFENYWIIRNYKFEQKELV